jgi:hypothetical protein
VCCVLSAVQRSGRHLLAPAPGTSQGGLLCALYGRLYLVRLFYELHFWYIFRCKNGDCIESDYYAVSGPSGAPDYRGSLVSRCRITLVPLGRSGSDRRAFYRVTGANLANLANLRLRAEAQYSSALLHSPRPLLMTQVSTSEVKCGRPPPVAPAESSSGLYL